MVNDFWAQSHSFHPGINCYDFNIHLQTLLDQKKAATLAPEKVIELETISSSYPQGVGELDEIFSYINAVMAASVQRSSRA
ncbi:hypothetical protein [Phormidesmis priestleyi]